MTSVPARSGSLAGAEVHFLNRSYSPAVGGVERQLTYLENLVAGQGGRVVIWTTTPPPGDAPPSATAVRRRCPGWVGGSTRRFLLWVTVGLILYRLVHPRRRMVVLAGRASAETAAALPVHRVFAVPLITYLAGGDAAGSEFSTQRRAWLKRHMARSVDVFVAHTQSYLDEVKAAGHGGIGLVVPTLAPSSSAGGCPQLLAPHGGIRVLWCGRNHPVKGIDRLGRIAAGPLRRSAGLTAICDTAPQLPDCVQIHAGCPDPRSHMADFDVLVLTSLHEGQPNVMAEAALEGVPTVALGVGGIPEAVATLGHGAVLAPDCTDAEFAAAAIGTAERYRNEERRAELRISARQLYVEKAEGAWRHALESGLAGSTGRTGWGSVVGALAGGRGIATVLSALWLFAAARILSLSAFGRLSLIVAVGGLLDVVSDLGIPLALTHRAASVGASRMVVHRALRNRLLADIPAIALLLLVYRMATGADLLAPLIFGASIAGSTVYSTYTAVLRGQGTVRIEATNEVASRLAVVAAGVPWLALGGGLTAAAATYALADVVSGLVVPIVASRRISWADSDPAARAHLQLRATLPLAAASAVNVVYYKLDVWILALMAGPAAVATYTIAGRLADLVMLPSRALNSVSLALSEGSGPRVGLRALSFRSLMMTAPGVILGLVCVGPVLPALLGHQYRSAVQPTRVLLLSCLLTAVLLAVAPSVAIRRRALFLAGSSAALAANVSLNLVLIPRLGATGAALASLGSEGLLVGLVVVRVAGWRPAAVLRNLLQQVDRRFAPQPRLEPERELKEV